MSKYVFSYWVIGDQFLHVPPAVGASPHQVDFSRVDDDPHGEPGLLHFGHHAPSVVGRVIAFDGTANVFANPPTKGIDVTERKKHNFQSFLLTTFLMKLSTNFSAMTNYFIQKGINFNIKVGVRWGSLYHNIS